MAESDRAIRRILILINVMSGNYYSGPFRMLSISLIIILNINRWFCRGNSKDKKMSYLYPCKCSSY